MPSKNMLPKGKRRQSVRAEYRKIRTELNEAREREKELADGPRPLQDNEEEMWDTAELMREHLPDPSNPYLRIANTAGTRNEPTTPDRPRYEGLKPPESMPREIHALEDLEPEAGIRSFIAEAAAAQMRVDAYLAKALRPISRPRAQLPTTTA